MKDEYIIINKTSIQKRIEELEKEKDEAALSENEYAVGYFTGQIHALYELISNSSQSTPLIPEIENAFDAGQEYGTNMALFYNTDKVSRVEFESTFDKEEYITNLKLDI